MIMVLSDSGIYTGNHYNYEHGNCGEGIVLHGGTCHALGSFIAYYKSYERCQEVIEEMKKHEKGELLDTDKKLDDLIFRMPKE